MGEKYTVTEIRERANEEVGLIGEERVVRAGSKSTLISVPVYFPPTHNPVLFLFAQDDGTDREFRNVGLYTSDAGEIPKRILNTG